MDCSWTIALKSCLCVFMNETQDEKQEMRHTRVCQQVYSCLYWKLAKIHDVLIRFYYINFFFFFFIYGVSFQGRYHCSLKPNCCITVKVGEFTNSWCTPPTQGPWIFWHPSFLEATAHNYVTVTSTIPEQLLAELFSTIQ